MEPTFRQLRYFIAVAYAGQVSRAAVELNVSQSAVTTAIKQLEEIVSCPLFTRNAEGMKLTDNGTIFLRHAEQVFAVLKEAVTAPKETFSSVKGVLRLAMTYTVAGYFMPPHLERFMRVYPEITVQPVEAPRSEIETGLVTGDFDLAVMLTSNIQNQEQLSYEVLLRSPRRLWLANGHPLFDQKYITLDDLKAEPYVMLTVDEAANTTQRYWNQAGVRPNIFMSTMSVEAVRSMVASSMAITILSDMVYRPWSLEGLRVEALTLATPIPSMDVGLAWCRQRELPPAAHAFAEFMRKSY